MHDLARPLALVLLAIIGVVSLWTPLAHAEIAARWFSLPNLFWFLPVPILVLVTFYALLRSVANNDHVKPFVLTLVLIFLGYSGLGISLWPNIIPPAVSIWRPRRRRRARASCWSARCSSFPSSSATPPGATTCSAAR